MINIVNIITFHHILPQKDTLSISPELFEKALITISKRFDFISYNEFIDIVINNKPIDSKKVLLTIDDGYLDNYIYAYPILKKLNIPAVIFLVTDNILDSNERKNSMPYFTPHKELNNNPDKNLFINKAEMKEMLESGLVDFDSHTTSHLVCKNKEIEILEPDFKNSLSFIKNYIKHRDIFGFCWPKGYFDEVALDTIRNSSYAFAFSTIDGAFHKGDDLYTIKRVDCSSSNSGETKYLKRLKRKLWIYSNPLVSKMYAAFREWRIRLKKR